MNENPLWREAEDLFSFIYFLFYIPVSAKLADEERQVFTYDTLFTSLLQNGECSQFLWAWNLSCE